MAQQNSESISLKPKEIETDAERLIALIQIGNYKPQRAEFSQSIAFEIIENLKKKREILIGATSAFNSATDALRAEEWRAHHFIQGAAQQVASQFTDNSDEYASLGYKKKMEYKRPARKKKS